MNAQEFFQVKAAIENTLHRFAELNIERSNMAGAYVTLDEFGLYGTGEAEHIYVSFTQHAVPNDPETHSFKLPLEFFDGAVI